MRIDDDFYTIHPVRSGISGKKRYTAENSSDHCKPR